MPTNPPKPIFIVGACRRIRGPLADGLNYERYAAGLYLNAKAGVSTGSQVAIDSLNTLLAQGRTRYSDEATQMLYDAPCQARRFLLGARQPLRRSDRVSSRAQYLISGQCLRQTHGGADSLYSFTPANG